jgi:hypothetical protein
VRTGQRVVPQLRVTYGVNGFGARVLPPELHHALNLPQHTWLRLALRCLLLSYRDIGINHVVEGHRLDGNALLLERLQPVVGFPRQINGVVAACCFQAFPNVNAIYKRAVVIKKVSFENN